MSTSLPVLIRRRLIALAIVAVLVLLAILIGSQHHQHTSKTAEPVSAAVTAPLDGFSATQERRELQSARAGRSRPMLPAKVTPKPVVIPSPKPKVIHHHAKIVMKSYSTGGVPSVWVALVQCEAGGRWRYGAPGVGIDAGYDFEGGPNFTHGTWVGAGGREFAEHAYDASPAEQVIIAKRVLRSQGVGAWPQCGPKVGLSRADSY